MLAVASQAQPTLAASVGPSFAALQVRLTGWSMRMLRVGHLAMVPALTLLC